MDNKLERWRQAREHYAQVTDALDEPIDPGILDLVVALNMLGITTTASCEGHLDRDGIASPWVDIEAPGDEEEEQRVRQALLAVQEEEERGQLPLEEIDAMYREAVVLHQRAGRKHLELRAKLTEYLTTFYHQRPYVSFRQRLVIQGEVIQGIGCPMRLESQGAGLQTLATQEERAENLRAYQGEMQAFAAFLKDVFFAS